MTLLTHSNHRVREERSSARGGNRNGGFVEQACPLSSVQTNPTLCFSRELNNSPKVTEYVEELGFKPAKSG